MRYHFAFAAFLAALACDNTPEPRAASAVAGLPEYTPEEASLFGDVLEPSAFGLPADVPPSEDPKLRLRISHADAVVRVQVGTVSEELLAGTKGFAIALTVEPPPLAGSAPESPLEIRIGASSPSMAQVQAEGSHFVGKRFVLFVRKYSHQGEPELHFYGEGDTPEFKQAFEQSRGLDEGSRNPHTRN